MNDESWKYEETEVVDLSVARAVRSPPVGEMKLLFFIDPVTGKCTIDYEIRALVEHEVPVKLASISALRGLIEELYKP